MLAGCIWLLSTGSSAKMSFVTRTRCSSSWEGRIPVECAVPVPAISSTQDDAGGTSDVGIASFSKSPEAFPAIAFVIFGIPVHAAEVSIAHHGRGGARSSPLQLFDRFHKLVVAALQRP